MPTAWRWGLGLVKLPGFLVIPWLKRGLGAKAKFTEKGSRRNNRPGLESQVERCDVRGNAMAILAFEDEHALIAQAGKRFPGRKRPKTFFAIRKRPPRKENPGRRKLSLSWP